MNIKIVNHCPDNPIPEMISVGNWIDLRSAEDIDLMAGDYDLISLGVSMKLPDGYEAIIAPRSSTYNNYGIICANSIGIIDNSYSGTNDIWKFPVIALQDTHISKGDRICQFRVVKSQPDIEFEVVSELDSKDRGGFGSTGIK